MIRLGLNGLQLRILGRVYVACRWAWPDPSSMLRRGVFYSPEITEAERPETPEFLDISTRSQRTAVLFKGLPYHRKHGIADAGHASDRWSLNQPGRLRSELC